MTPQKKKYIAKLIRGYFRNTYPEVSAQQNKSCLYWADSACKILCQRGVRAVIQAGTLQWPRIKASEDDGVIASHFTYLWDSNNILANAKCIQSGWLPEMHVWAAIPQENELIDMTTRFLKEQCARTTGLPWTNEDPPDYVWCKAELLPEKRIYYVPDMKAIQVALQMLSENSGVILMR